MSSIKLVSSLCAICVLSACATMQPVEQPAPKPIQAAAPAPVMKAPEPIVRAAPAPFFSMQTGTYRCELNRKVQVTKVSTDQSMAVLRWNRKDYTMRVVDARSGALRYEHNSGLTWITVVGKSMLLDTKRGKQLANECRV